MKCSLWFGRNFSVLAAAGEGQGQGLRSGRWVSLESQEMCFHHLLKVLITLISPGKEPVHKPCRPCQLLTGVSPSPKE